MKNTTQTNKLAQGVGWFFRHQNIGLFLSFFVLLGSFAGTGHSASTLTAEQKTTGSAPVQVASLPALHSGFSQRTEAKYSLGQLVRVTRNQSILTTLQMMPGTEAESALDKIIRRRGRIVLKKMDEMGRAVRNYNALSWISQDGDWVIFINKKHADAPPEALMALIAHEAIHDDIENSLNEEIAGWSTEARIWQSLKTQNPELKRIYPGQNALVDRLNQLSREYNAGTLEYLVRRNKGYEKLSKTSPGFETTHRHHSPDTSSIDFGYQSEYSQ